MRSPLDFYETPKEAVDALFDNIDISNVHSILDPAAGSGALIRGIENCVVTAVDIDNRHGASLEKITPNVWLGDFLETNPKALGYHSIVLANPPYYLAEEFVKHSMLFCDNGYFLLRLNFLGSAKRKKWLKMTRPNIKVLSKRPSFTGDGRTDGTEYAWFHFSNSSRWKGGEWEII